MSSVRTRSVRRRHRRVQSVERSTAPGRLPARQAPKETSDPYERRTLTGMRPYEMSYDVSHGYTGDRLILLP
ncbi:hypothetical protein BH23GEM9_BH23GEM9_03190 [soil metagenome]